MSDSISPPSRAPGPAAVDAFCEYLRLLEVGQEADFETFCGERAELEPELRRLYGEYERVTAILERLAPAASFSVRLRERYGPAVDPGVSLSRDDGPQAREAGALTQRLAALRAAGGRYEPRGEIARGGMGAILKVWDRELRRMLAMKVVLARRGEVEEDSDAEVGERRLSRFLEEAQITAQLDHPGIVPVHDLGLDAKGRVYFTMQLIDGRDLREVFELAQGEREGWTRTRVLWAMLRVCEAMAYAHSKGVVHRDLKPANIMVGRYGETYVMDWGLAKVTGREDKHDLRLSTKPAEETESEGRRVITDRSTSSDDQGSPLRTLDGDVVGTPAYMSPEQALGRLGEIGPQSDVYSVGAMLYHLFSGHMPYEPLGERVPTTTVLEAVRSGAPWPLQKIAPSCNPELVAIAEKAMEREPARRYPDVMALAEDLRAFLEGRGVRAYETGALYEFRKWVSRNRGVATSLGALVLLGLISVGVFIRQQQQSLEQITGAHAQTEKERRAALDAQQSAEKNARELALESKRLEVARQDALEKQKLAEQNWQMALENAEMTRRQSYRAQILAADFSLRLEDVAVAKASLADTDPDLRDWEWRYLKLASEGSTRELLRLPHGIADLSTSADGSLLICIGLDLVARVIDVESARARAEITTTTFGGWSRANPHRVRAELSPRGGLGLAAAQGDAILVFNSIDGTALGQIPHAGAKTSLGFSADGRRMVSASDAGTAVVFENTGVNIRQLAELAGHEGAVLCAVLSPGGERVLTGGADGTARVFEAATGRELARLPGDRTRAVMGVAWAPRPLGEEEHVAVAYDDGSIAVFDVRTRELATVLHGHTQAVRALVFGQQARTLYSGGDDMTLRMWRLPSGRVERVFRGHDREVTGLALAANGTRLVSSSLDGTVRMWDPEWDPAVTIVRTRGNLLGLGFSAEDRYVISCPERGGARAWEAASGLPAFVLDPPSTSTGAPAPELHQALAISADGSTLATCGLDERLRIRGAEDGELYMDLPGPSRRVRVLALSPDGTSVAAGVSDGSVWLWSWKESPRPRVLEGHRRDVMALVFAPDGNALASAGRDRSLRLWNGRSGAPLGIWTDAHSLTISDVAFSPDGQFILTASTDGSARIWSESTRKPLLTFAGKESALTAVAVSPAGGRVVTGSASGELALWDMQTGDLLLYLQGHRGPIIDLAFSHDGTRIASCSSERDSGETEVRIWESNPGAPRHASRTSEQQRRERAREFVELLYMRHHWPQAVFDALPGALPAGEPALLAAAEREAQLFSHDPEFLAASCFDLLLQPGAAVEDCHKALLTAGRVVELRGGDASALSLLGAAQVRAQRYEEGLRSLRDAERRRDPRDRVQAARDGVFVALAQLALEREDAAHEALAESRSILSRLHEAAPEELEPLMALLPLMRLVEMEIEQGR